ncbi:beta-galactosidase [Bacteroides sp. 1001136B_160425_E2]|uniref:beta-galactosidase n=1 Tax=Bacteroides sp. 1001136B_160425_E2 TaxID=2787083 RepID=UPI0018A078E5|nr:beta-galactosidase [Bacteroides sp. 1001136B_160425_E2]
MKFYILAIVIVINITANAQMYVGSAYYPEQLSKERIDKDASLMQEAHLNMVRIGDFAWSSLESEDGNFSFEWMDNAIHTLQKKGIQTLLCTPTAAIPKWMCDVHPDIMQVQVDGQRKAYGRRRHACYSNEAYRTYCVRIVRELAARYKENPAVIGFQIDNEMTTEDPYCYCENCRMRFVEWLQKKYKTIGKLNQSWGTTFWSETLNSFSQAWLPRRMDNPAIYLDYQRFVSDCTLDFYRMQRDEIKKIAPRMLCTTNVGGGGFVTTIDLYQLGKECDVLSIDNYPINCTVENLYGNNVGQPFEPSMVSFALQQIRGGRKENIWVTEEQVGRTALTQREIVPDGIVRLWTHQQLAYGCNMSVFFPFRAFESAHEHLMAGVVESDYVKRDKYQEIQQTAHEVRALYAKTGKLLPIARVAIIRDFDADWTFENGYTFCPDLKYLREVYAYYKALRSRSVMVDMVSPDADLSPYDCVIIPYLALVAPDFPEKIETKVKKGATVVMTCLTGVRDKEFHKFDGGVYQPLQRLAGIEIERQEALFGRKHNTLDYVDSTAICKYWFDKVKPVQATVLSRYNGAYFKDAPAITCNRVGDGKMYYVATVPEQKVIDQLMNVVISETSLKPIAHHASPLMEIAELQDMKGNSYLYLINFSGDLQQVVLNYPGNDVMTGEEWKAGTVSVNPMEYKVLRIKK